MSMLKHVLTFFAFIMASLAPASADEGYIPFFPDFLEPDGIGYRGPSEYQKMIVGLMEIVILKNMIRQVQHFLGVNGAREHFP